MSDTPKTDKAIVAVQTGEIDGEWGVLYEFVDADFARKLERELARVKAELAGLEDWVKGQYGR